MFRLLLLLRLPPVVWACSADQPDTETSPESDFGTVDSGEPDVDQMPTIGGLTALVDLDPADDVVEIALTAAFSELPLQIELPDGSGEWADSPVFSAAAVTPCGSTRPLTTPASGGLSAPFWSSPGLD